MTSSESSQKKSSQKRMTVPRFVARKAEGPALTMLTAYDFSMAHLFDAAGVDAILVGDSLGMVVQGKSTTLPVSMDEMIYHAEIVARAVKKSLVIVDMPFMSFQVSPEQAVANAGRLLKETGATAVKLEGGVAQAETIRALRRVDLPVMGHIGMQPQSVHQMGSMGAIQRNEKQLIDNAKAVEEAGAFAIVLELIPQKIAQKVTAAISIPTIGIGAGPHCDGQVLVGHDMLGMTDGFQPKFLQQFGNIGEQISQAAHDYITAVQSATFPTKEHSHD